MHRFASSLVVPLALVLSIAFVPLAGCGGASGDAGGGASYPESFYSQPKAPLCDALLTFVASAKDSPPFASTHADAIPNTDYLWHTKVRPEGAMFCTVSRDSAEAGDPTILCEYDGKNDPNAVIADLSAKTQACLGPTRWQASEDDSTVANAWFSEASGVKVSVYVLPAQGGKLDVMLDLDPLPESDAPPPPPAPTPR